MYRREKSVIDATTKLTNRIYPRLLFYLHDRYHEYNDECNAKKCVYHVNADSSWHHVCQRLSGEICTS